MPQGLQNCDRMTQKLAISTDHVLHPLIENYLGIIPPAREECWHLSKFSECGGNSCSNYRQLLNICNRIGEKNSVPIGNTG